MTHEALFLNKFEQRGVRSFCVLMSLVFVTGVFQPAWSTKVTAVGFVALLLAMTIRMSGRPSILIIGHELLIRGTVRTRRLSLNEIDSVEIYPGLVGAFTREILLIRMRSADPISLGQFGIYARKNSEASTRLRSAASAITASLQPCYTASRD